MFHFKLRLIVISLLIAPVWGATHRGYIAEDLWGLIYGYDWSVPKGAGFAPRPAGMGVIGGIAISADGRKLFVSSAGQIWVMDTDTFTYSPQTIAANVVYMAVSPDGRFLYGGSSNGLTVVDLASNTVSQTIPLAASPFRLAVTPDNTHVVAITASMAALIRIGNPHTLRGYVTLPGPANDVAISPDSKRAMLPMRQFGLATIDLATMAKTEASIAGCDPHSVSFSPAGTRLYAACGSNREYRVLHGTTRAVIASGRVPDWTQGIRTVMATPDGTAAWFTTEPYGTTVILDAATLTLSGWIGGAEHCDHKLVFGPPSYSSIDAQAGLAAVAAAREAAPAACAVGQIYRVTARWRNNSARSWTSAFAEVLTLTGGHTLIEQSWDLTADRIVKPGEVFSGTFRIRLNNCAPFTFQVSLAGLSETAPSRAVVFLFSGPAMVGEEMHAPELSIEPVTEFDPY